MFNVLKLPKIKKNTFLGLVVAWELIQTSVIIITLVPERLINNYFECWWVFKPINLKVGDYLLNGKIMQMSLLNVNNIIIIYILPYLTKF